MNESKTKTKLKLVSTDISTKDFLFFRSIGMEELFHDWYFFFSSKPQLVHQRPMLNTNFIEHLEKRFAVSHSSNCNRFHLQVVIRDSGPHLPWHCIFFSILFQIAVAYHNKILFVFHHLVVFVFILIESIQMITVVLMNSQFEFDFEHWNSRSLVGASHFKLCTFNKWTGMLNGRGSPANYYYLCALHIHWKWSRWLSSIIVPVLNFAKNFTSGGSQRTAGLIAEIVWLTFAGFPSVFFQLLQLTNWDWFIAIS